jgi:spermidine synthase
LAAYARPGDSYRFYEVNPAVIQIARTEFYYLRDCAGKADVVLGDGRLALECEPPWRFDLLAVDAFSGDAIPIHLLTAEAFQLYLSHLKPDGVLAVHITNRYLDLQPVVLRQAEHAGMRARVIHNLADDEEFVYEATWVLASATRSPPYRGPDLWTDDFSNLLQALK